jgi:hypothetical protein
LLHFTDSLFFFTADAGISPHREAASAVVLLRQHARTASHSDVSAGKEPFLHLHASFSEVTDMPLKVPNGQTSHNWLFHATCCPEPHTRFR